MSEDNTDKNKQRKGLSLRSQNLKGILETGSVQQTDIASSQAEQSQDAWTARLGSNSGIHAAFGGNGPVARVSWQTKLKQRQSPAENADQPEQATRTSSAPTLTSTGSQAKGLASKLKQTQLFATGQINTAELLSSMNKSRISNIQAQLQKNLAEELKQSSARDRDNSSLLDSNVLPVQALSDPSMRSADYPPLSLPFTDTAAKLSARKPLDEVLKMEAIADDFFFIFQWPHRLPALNKYQMGIQNSLHEEGTLSEEIFLKVLSSNGNGNNISTAAKVADWESDATTSLKDWPAGKLGKMRIRRSGKCELVIGSHCFDIDDGATPGFTQDAVLYMPDNNNLVKLGQCRRRLVITPSLREFETMT